MTATVSSIEKTPSLGELPSRSKIVTPGERLTLEELDKRVTAAFAAAHVRLTPFRPPQPDKQLTWYKTRARVPLTAGNDVDCLVVIAVGPWTEARTDAFIADYAHLRLEEGLPQFRLYATHPVPPEIQFLFETLDAGVFEISAWDLVEDEDVCAEDCIEFGEVGRRLISEVYGVDLDDDDLQWLSIVNQLVCEDLRWFADEPDARLPDHIDYVPFGSLLLMACVAGEAIRLNHPSDLLWSDADGDNWPRIARHGKTADFPVIDATFKRFEMGSKHDVWELYKDFHTAQQLSPPASFDAILVDPLEFLPSWDPEADADLEQTVASFQEVCLAEDLEIEPHPLGVSGHVGLENFLQAFTCLRDDQRYDLFVATGVWTEARTLAFVRVFGHRSLAEWEVGANPVFVFFSGHPLTPMLEYCFIDGPPVAPLEGLARVETPAPAVPANTDVIHPLALWLLHGLELYTTIGLDLQDDSVLAGLEFLVREDLSQKRGAQAPADDDPHVEVFDLDGFGSWEPLALLVTIGMTAGEALRMRHTDGRVRWVQGDVGGSWPAMELDLPLDGGTIDSTVRFDWVEAARRLWRGEAEDFGFRTITQALA